MRYSLKQTSRSALWGGAALIFGAFLALALWDPEVRASEPSERPRLRVAAVEASEIAPRFRFRGYLRAHDRARLGFTSGGRVLERPVEVGQRVRAGDLLVRLDRQGFSNAARAARASVDELELRTGQLERDHARVQVLAENGVTHTSQLEQSQSGLARARAMRSAADAQWREARRMVRETVLTAPFDGVVTEVLVQSEEMVQPGQPVVAISAEEANEVQVSVPAPVARTLRAGSAAELRSLEGEDVSFQGRIDTVATAVDSTGLYPVVVSVTDRLAAQPGLAVEVVLEGARRPAIEIPLTAVLNPSGQRPFVWKVVDGRIERAWLTLGSLGSETVEVRSGLEDGEEIVVEGHGHLLPGDRVDEGAQ